MSMTLELLPELESQVRNAARRDGIGPDAYVLRVLERHLHKELLAVSETEAELLAEINVGLTAQEWSRYFELREGLEEETLHDAEYVELLGFTNRIENANAKRLEALIKLAALRDTNLDALIEDMGLRPAAYG